jgi:hypothetical protein
MGTKWRNSHNSPDWTDIFTLMRGIEALHSVTVFVTLTAGTYDGVTGYTTIFAHHTAKSGEASVLGEPVAILAGEWPCPHHRDYVSCLYSALMEMDSKLSAEVWKQSTMPFTAE